MVWYSYVETRVVATYAHSVILDVVVRSADYAAEEGIRSLLAEGKLLVPDSFPGNERNKLCFSSKLDQIPLGVQLVIPPFNYLVNLSISKLAPALIAGNAVVLKPPTQGAVVALHMIHCFHLAGFPKGLVSAITVKVSELGDVLTTHPPAVNCIRFFGTTQNNTKSRALDMHHLLQKKGFFILNHKLIICVKMYVRQTSFTSGDTGIAIAKRAGMIPLQTELGGKDVCIVLNEADFELAASNIIKGGFSYMFSMGLFSSYNVIKRTI